MPDAAAVSVNPLPASLHHTKRLEASSPKLKDIMQGQSWPSLSPLNAAALVPEQKLLIEASKSGSDAVRKLSHSWRTAFLASGLVVKQKGTSVTYMCLGLWPSNSAAGMIPLERVELESQKIYFWKLPDKIECQFKCVYSFSDWSVLDTVRASPLHVALVSVQKSKTKSYADFKVPQLPGLFLEKSKSVTPLLKYVAKEGFYLASVGMLKRLLKETCRARVQPNVKRVIL